MFSRSRINRCSLISTASASGNSASGSIPAISCACSARDAEALRDLGTGDRLCLPGLGHETVQPGRSLARFAQRSFRLLERACGLLRLPLGARQGINGGAVLALRLLDGAEQPGAPRLELGWPGVECRLLGLGLVKTVGELAEPLPRAACPRSPALAFPHQLGDPGTATVRRLCHLVVVLRCLVVAPAQSYERGAQPLALVIALGALCGQRVEHSTGCALHLPGLGDLVFEPRRGLVERGETRTRGRSLGRGRRAHPPEPPARPLPPHQRASGRAGTLLRRLPWPRPRQRPRSPPCACRLPPVHRSPPARSTCCAPPADGLRPSVLRQPPRSRPSARASLPRLTRR